MLYWCKNWYNFFGSLYDIKTLATVPSVDMIMPVYADLSSLRIKIPDVPGFKSLFKRSLFLVFGQNAAFGSNIYLR